MSTESSPLEPRLPVPPAPVPVSLERTPSAPTILIFTTRRWFSAARLAMAFSRAGTQVQLLSPPGHPAMLTRSIGRHHRFRALQPLRSMVDAIRASGPDLMVPTDEAAAIYLHRLYNRAPRLDADFAPAIRSLLARSLGDPVSFPHLESRTSMLAVAREEGILVPPTEPVTDKHALRSWLAHNSLPAVLKADGTSGGEGVEIVSTPKQAMRAWSRLHAPLGLIRTAKKAGFEHDANHLVPWLTRRRRRVSIQAFVSGHDANVAVACWQGEVLGAVSLDVLQTWRPKGPSALVELTKNNPMLAAVRAMVRRLHLSGLYGFDFMVEDPATDQPSSDPPRAWLIELNARATQTSHLPYGVPRNLIPALFAALSSRPLPAEDYASRHGVIALFPLAWQAGIGKQILDSALQDIPWDEPLLVKAGFAQPRESSYEKWNKLWARGAAPHPLPGESK